MNGYFKEINRNKCLTLVPTKDKIEKMKNYQKGWSKIRYLTRSISQNSSDYDKRYMKIKFKFNYELPLNKAIKIRTTTIVVRTVFHESSKYYPQVFLDECLINYK